MKGRQPRRGLDSTKGRQQQQLLLPHLRLVHPRAIKALPQRIRAALLLPNGIKLKAAAERNGIRALGVAVAMTSGVPAGQKEVWWLVWPQLLDRAGALARCLLHHCPTVAHFLVMVARSSQVIRRV